MHHLLFRKSKPLKMLKSMNTDRKFGAMTMGMFGYRTQMEVYSSTTF